MLSFPEGTIHPADEKSLLKGTLLTILAFFFFAVFGGFLKAASSSTSTMTSGSTPALWINFIAYLTALVLYTPLILYKGAGYLKTQHFGRHLARAFFGVIATIAYIFSIKFIPLLNATLLFNTTPIFIPIFAMFILHIHVNWMTWLAIFIGFIGIFFVIHPSVASLEKPGDLVGLLSGMMLALAFIFVKILSITEPSLRIVYYFLLLATLMQVPLLYFLPELPTLHSIGYAICAGAAFCFAQLFVTMGYKYAEASKIGVFQYSGILFVGIIDWWIWGIKPGLMDIIGSLLVILAAALIITMPLWVNRSKKNI